MANKQDVLNEILAGAEKKALTGRMQNAEVNHHPATEAAVRPRLRESSQRQFGKAGSDGRRETWDRGSARPGGEPVQSRYFNGLARDQTAGIGQTQGAFPAPGSDGLLGKRHEAETDHLIERRFRLLLIFHDQARMAEPDASGVDEARRKCGI